MRQKRGFWLCRVIFRSSIDVTPFLKASGFNDVHVVPIVGVHDFFMRSWSVQSCNPGNYRGGVLPDVSLERLDIFQSDSLLSQLTMCRVFYVFGSCAWITNGSMRLNNGNDGGYAHLHWTINSARYRSNVAHAKSLRFSGAKSGRSARVPAIMWLSVTPTPRLHLGNESILVSVKTLLGVRTTRSSLHLLRN